MCPVTTSNHSGLNPQCKKKKSTDKSIQNQRMVSKTSWPVHAISVVCGPVIPFPIVTKKYNYYPEYTQIIVKRYQQKYTPVYKKFTRKHG